MGHIEKNVPRPLRKYNYNITKGHSSNFLSNNQIENLSNAKKPKNYILRSLLYS